MKKVNLTSVLCNLYIYKPKKVWNDEEKSSMIECYVCTECGEIRMKAVDFKKFD
jgi:hypothetical protein